MPSGTESPPAPGADGLRVGGWMVEPALNELSSAGRVVKLEPKAMSVLMVLADRPGQVVSREALLSAVWPGVVVGDDSLTQVVIKLRKALGDVPDKPAYIQTISKRGYRLIAPVVRSAQVASASIAPDSTLLSARRMRRLAWIAATGLAVLLVAAAGIWWSNNERMSGVAPGAVTIPSSEAARTARPTVTIRPFEALGDDPQSVLLARGITADLLTDLSKLSGLWVIDVAPLGKQATESPTDVPPIRYVVSGTVERVDERLRLNVYLTDAQTGKQLWSERFDRAQSGLFAIQDELGPKILQILPAKVSEAELRRVAQRDTHNLEAYEYFQRGDRKSVV